MNIKKAKEDIKNTVRAYLNKDAAGQYKIPEIRQRPILLLGPPGIGKTQIMGQIARECEIGLVSYTITHHTRQSAVGLPFIKEEEFDGQKHSVTEYTMSEIIYSIHNYMKTSGKREGILFIDEINCVSETLAPTMLQFLQCKTFGNQVVPKGWIIVAAGNPPEYNKSVREFDFVTLDRVRKMDVEADLDAFRGYARSKHLHPFILSYLELRPQNFYKTENDVDGIEFVTARGWEDLGALIETYESLDIPVDEDTIHQFLQHKDIAKDVAAYYDLYQKYKDEYDISHILSGQVRPGVFESLMRASFDERLSAVELLVSGLHNLVSEALKNDFITNKCYELLKEYRAALKNDSLQDHSQLTNDSVKNHSQLTSDSLYLSLISKKEEAYNFRLSSGLLTPEEQKMEAEIFSLLKSWCPDYTLAPKEAFQSVKNAFDNQCDIRTASIEQASSALEYAFTFMEDAFNEGQEMVIFVTELTMDPDISRFIAQNGCERYVKYNKTLLIGSRRASILQELNKDRIYADASAYEF